VKDVQLIYADCVSDVLFVNPQKAAAIVFPAVYWTMTARLFCSVCVPTSAKINSA